VSFLVGDSGYQDDADMTLHVHLRAMTNPNSSRQPASSFRQPDVWALAMDLVMDVYSLSALFPRDERFGLTAQVRRAAVSIPANIAEGKARFGHGEYRRFISIALGSVAELQTELEIAERLKFVSAEQLAATREKLHHVGPMLTNLAKRLST